MVKESSHQSAIITPPKANPLYVRDALAWKARAMRDKVAIITTILPRGQNHLNFKNQPRVPIITHFIGRHIRGILGPPLSRILSPELLLLLDLASVGVNDLLRAAGASHGDGVSCSFRPSAAVVS